MLATGRVTKQFVDRMKGSRGDERYEQLRALVSSGIPATTRDMSGRARFLTSHRSSRALLAPAERDIEAIVAITRRSGALPLSPIHPHWHREFTGSRQSRVLHTAAAGGQRSSDWRDPSARWWHPASILLVLAAMAAEQERLVHAQEQQEELSWSELVSLADALSIDSIDFDFDPDHPHKLQQECFNQLASIVLSRSGAARIAQLDSDKIARVRDQRGNSLLHVAVGEGAKIGVIRQIIDAQRTAGVRSVNDEGDTPLHLAARHGFAHLFEDLKSDLYKTNLAGQTPLHVAIIHDQRTFVEQVVKPSRPEELERDGVKLSPLALAIWSGAKQSVRALSPSPKELQQSVEGVGTLLHLAVHCGRLDMVEFLFRDRVYQTSVEALLLKEDDAGRTPFALACAEGDVEMARMLHDKGNALVGGQHLNYADVRRKWTPAHWAAHGSHFLIVYQLADWEAKLDAMDAHGRLPADVAKKMSGFDAQDTLTALESAQRAGARPASGSTIAPPHNLVFRGGGPRGVAYVGVLRAMKDKGVDRQVYRVAGTSAGAITAAMYALAYSPDDMESELKAKNLLDLLDPKDGTCNAMLQAILTGKNSRSYTRAIGTLLAEGAAGLRFTPPWQYYRELSSFNGLCVGKDAREWIEGLIRKQVRKITGKDIPSLTFGELRRLIGQGHPFKHVRFFATPASGGQKPVCFSSEDPQYDDVVISSAVLASMTIPGVFAPTELMVKTGGAVKTDPKRGAFFDGGLLRNRPLEIFDAEDGTHNRRTLCLSVRDVDGDGGGPPAATPSGPVELVRTVAMIYMDAEAALQNLDGRSMIEVEIEEVGLLDFDMKLNQMDKLIAAGYDAVMQSPLFSRQDGATADERTRRSVLAPLQHFTGRKGELRQISDRLKDRTLPFDKRILVHLISGLPGIGKSELARKAIDEALDSGDHLSYAFELDYRDLDSGYREIASRLRIPIGEQVTPASVRRKVCRALEARDDPWYLVVHHVKRDQRVDRDLLPERGGHVLITAHLAAAWDDPDTHIALTSLSSEEGAELISKITGEPICDDLRKLSRELGGYPLAIDQAARFIRGHHAEGQPNDTTATAYLQSIESGLSALDAGASPNRQRYAKTLKVVWDKSLRHIKEKHPVAWQWLRESCWLDSENIPLHWMEHWIQHRSPDDEPDPKAVTSLIALLRSYGIVRELSRDESGEYLSRHALLQEAIRTTEVDRVLDDTDYLATLKFTLDHMHVCKQCHKSEYRKVGLYLPHIQALMDHASTLGIGQSREQLELLKYRAEIRSMHGDERSAIVARKEALAILSKLPDASISEVAEANFELGDCYLRLHLMEAAEPFMDAYLSGVEAEHGEDSLELFVPLSRLSYIYESTSRPEMSLAALERLKSILDGSPDTTDYNRACLNNNFATYYYKIEDYPSAIEYLKEADKTNDELVKKGEMKDTDSDRVMTKRNLGMSYYKNGEFAIARDYHKWVLDDRRSQYFPDHPVVMEALFFYGQALSKLPGQSEEAMKALRESLEIAVRIHADPHRDIDQLLDVLAECLEGMGYGERPSHLEEILPLCRLIYSDDHEKMVRLVKAGQRPWYRSLF